MSATSKPTYRAFSITAAICFALATVLLVLSSRLPLQIATLLNGGTVDDVITMYSSPYGLQEFVGFTFFIIPLIVLMVFSLLAAKGKTDTPLFIVGIICWTLARIGEEAPLFSYYIRVATNMGISPELITMVLTDGLIITALTVLAISSLIKTKVAWATVIPSGLLVIGFVLMFCFETVGNLEWLIAEYASHASVYPYWYLSVQILSTLALGLFGFAFAAGMFFSSFAAVSHQPKTPLPMLTDEPCDTPNDTRSSTISDEK